MQCEYISPSRATLYEQCEMRYKMRYELCLPEPTNQRQDTGLFVHKALELYYSPRFQYSIEEAWQKAATGNTCTPLEEFVVAHQMYLDTIAKFPREKVCTIDTEVKFDHLFDTGLHIRGVIDRIDIMRSDCLRIIDFKTGSRIMSSNEMRNSHQANMYPLWALFNPAFESFNHIVFSYMYIREGIIRDITVTKEQLMSYKLYLESLQEQIISNDNPTPTLNNYCWNCPGRSNCHAYASFMSNVMNGSKPFGEGPSDLTIDNAHDLLTKVKAGIAILEREKKMLEAWIVCMLETCPQQKHKTDQGETLSLSSKKSVQPDLGVVMQLARDRGLTDDVIDIKNSRVEEVFKDDPVALDIIRSSANVEFGQPFIVTTKGKGKGKGE